MSIPTAEELREMDGRICTATTIEGHFIIGDIAIEDDKVFILHNNSDNDGIKPQNMKGYKYGWLVAYKKIGYNYIAINKLNVF